MLKVINVTAVPFHLARLQSSTTKNIFQRAAEISSTQSSNIELPILTPIQNINISSQRKTNTLTPSTLNDRMVKKRNRVLRNRLAAKVSREKWRLHKDLLEQQLQNLKMEKMRLLTENEELRLQHNHLEEENLSLKTRWEMNPEEGSCVPEDTLEHASFVNIPLQKEWVLPHVFTILLMTLTELPVATVPNIPHIEDFRHFEELFEFSDVTDFYEESDVFVCPLSQDVTKETWFHDTTAVARTVCQVVEVSCMEEETNPSSDTSPSDEEMKSGTDEVIELANSFPSYPQLWTFENLYEDLDDGISLFP